MGNGFAAAFFEALSIKLIAFLRAKEDSAPLGSGDGGEALELGVGVVNTRAV
jgi:hypothetical protein